MGNFVGSHLEEMADIRATRKCKLVRLCSIISFVVLLAYGLTHFLDQEYTRASINVICCIIVGLNFWQLTRNEGLQYTDIMLTGVLMFQGLVLLFYSGQYPERLVWLFPLMISVIIINEFKVGLICSLTFCFLLLTTSLFLQTSYVISDLQSGFILSIFASCVICNTASFYYSKLLNYIQSLYKEGIEDLAYLDQLTGLANRWSFENWAKQKLTEVTNLSTTTALIFLDIDDFKEINDTYGHAVGDRVLQNFSRRLKNNIRTRDRKSNHHDYSIARFAGDEFVILLYDVRSKKDLDGILHRICHLFQDSYTGSNRVGSLTISVGVALYPQDATNLSELTRCADKAMYAAKHSGKNQYQYYQNDLLYSLEEMPSKHNVHDIKRASASHIHKPKKEDQRDREPHGIS
ncbi:GGDEF domain-containing protein [Vibrio sp. 404]|uniref:GGDEF domain-containing protein n=1 Tax=Vibrio marinisediminis TaxID=2758441 RepID=A0A7W2FN03_9VIBR|nr:GGDEF domain-containing protein [Vibrio marinisediminis]